MFWRSYCQKLIASSLHESFVFISDLQCMDDIERSGLFNLKSSTKASAIVSPCIGSQSLPVYGEVHHFLQELHLNESQLYCRLSVTQLDHLLKREEMQTKVKLF